MLMAQGISAYAAIAVAIVTSSACSAKDNLYADTVEFFGCPKRSEFSILLDRIRRTQDSVSWILEGLPDNFQKRITLAFDKEGMACILLQGRQYRQITIEHRAPRGQVSLEFFRGSSDDTDSEVYWPSKSAFDHISRSTSVKYDGEFFPDALLILAKNQGTLNSPRLELSVTGKELQFLKASNDSLGFGVTPGTSHHFVEVHLPSGATQYRFVNDLSDPECHLETHIFASDRGLPGRRIAEPDALQNIKINSEKVFVRTRARRPSTNLNVPCPMAPRFEPSNSRGEAK